MTSRPIPTKGVPSTTPRQFTETKIAYFSMEIGIHPDIHTYAGGLGILAGDMVRSATDLGIPLVGVTLLYDKGYLKQTFDGTGWQNDGEDGWSANGIMRALPTVALTLSGKRVAVSGFLYIYAGASGKTNPVIFLSTNLEENTPEIREITARLYAGDDHHRLLQESVLGIGGMLMLRALGMVNIHKYHMNEGHSALLTLELLKEHGESDDALAYIKERCVFTTHTPIAAGHDQFPRSMAEEVLSAYLPAKRDYLFVHDALHMTILGLMHSGYVNGVAKRHGEVTREMFPGYTIDAITNGVHAGTWVTPSVKHVFTHHFAGWEQDPYSLRYALAIPTDELWNAHQESKRALITLVQEMTGVALDEQVFTIGFARRATAYKRPEFIFSDLERLTRIASTTKGIQIIMGGKAHPKDHEGKLMIQRILRLANEQKNKVRIVFLPDYTMEIAQVLVAGVDLWLNTPQRPQEASGTSGMKAALNGVPHFSILDGWWLEGHIEHVTGWSIGNHPEQGESSPHEDQEDMYSKLEYIILPKYYSEREKWIKMMRSVIAINGSFFHTHRMVEQYVLNAYFK